MEGEAGAMAADRHSAQRRYPVELKERAVRMVIETRRPSESWWMACRRVASQLDVGAESLRTWTRQARVDAGKQPGLTSEERVRLVELERENRELRRANEILKAASVGSARDRNATVLSESTWEVAGGEGAAGLLAGGAARVVGALGAW